uniref:Uncharacterized protein n=1 Tax=Moniliophthora roreri TaxID=221103 RepID=A0A0W0G5A1_MONRR
MQDDEIIEEEDSEDDEVGEQPEPELDATAGATFEETPAKRAVGRNGLRRQKTHLKLAALHRFGARCIVTLMAVCLQLAHVIPVNTSNKDVSGMGLWRRIRVDSHPFLLKFMASLLHTVEPRMHYALDRGLIKIVPTINILNAIFMFSRRIREKHAGKKSNENIGLDRKETFPPGNYPYMVVGVLCSSEFSIPRERLIEPSNVPEVAMKQNTEWLFKYQPIDYPIKVPRQWTDQEDAINPQSKDGHLKAKVIPQHLKGYHSDRKTPYEGFYPVENQGEVLLWQDPWLVVANVGEFLFVLKSRMDNDRCAKVKPGEEWLPWQVEELVKDPLHVQLLEMCLQIYTYWQGDKGPKPERPLPKLKGPKAGGSRQSRQTTKADAPIAGPSGSSQDAVAADGSGPTTRSRSKAERSNAGTVHKPTGASPTQARSRKGKSRAGTEGSVQPLQRAPSRKSTRSKTGTSKNDT